MVTIELIIISLSIFGTHAACISGRVVGGKDAVPAQFPHQISLRRQGNHICGGSIVGARYILTAAHCVVQSGIQPYPAAQFTILAGSINRFNGGVVRNVNKVTVHKDFSNFLNDFAVLQLSEPLIFSDFIKKIDLLTEDVPDGADIIISGWGRMVPQVLTLPTILKWNTLEAISKPKCALAIGFFVDSLLCLAHLEDNGACNGDSGGPATFNGLLAGVAGFVVSGCGSAKPDGYAKVSHNIKWIRSNINDNQ